MYPTEGIAKSKKEYIRYSSTYYLCLSQITFTDFHTRGTFYVKVYEDVYSFPSPMTTEPKFIFDENFNETLPYSFRLYGNGVSIVYYSHNPQDNWWTLEWETKTCSGGIYF